MTRKDQTHPSEIRFYPGTFECQACEISLEEAQRRHASQPAVKPVQGTFVTLSRDPRATSIKHYRVFWPVTTMKDTALETFRGWFRHLAQANIIQVFVPRLRLRDLLS